MDQYTFEGTTYNVAPSRLEEFKQKFPQATKIGEEVEEPTKVSTMLSNLGLSFVEFAQGVERQKEAIQLGITELLMPGEMTVAEKRGARAAIKSINLGSSDSYEPIVEKLEQNIPQYETQSITEDIQKGNYAQAGFRTVNAALRSAPSLIAAATGIGGLVALGGSVAGNKFEEEFEADPTKSTGLLLANAGLTGATEATFELITRGLLKKAGFLRGQGNIKAAKELLQGGAKNIIKNIAYGISAEGASEAATELVIALEDRLTLGKKIDKDLLYRLGDAFVVGSFIGGGISTVGEFANRSELAKERAETILMPEDIKQDINTKVNQLNELVKDLPEASEEGKSIIEDQINTLEQDIISQKQKSSRIVNSLKGKDLQNYFNNVNEINKQKNIIQKANTKSETKLAKNKIQELIENNNSIIQEVATKQTAQITESVRQQIKEGDLPGKVTELTSEEISNIKEEGFDSKQAAKQFGFINQKADGSFEIFLNKDKPMIGTAGHEFLHAVLFKTIKNNKTTQDALGDALIEYVSKLGGDKTVLGQRLSAYGKFNKEGVFVRDSNFGEETMTILSEEILNGNLKFEENFFTKIGDIIRRFSQDYLGRQVIFNRPRDVYNFVKDYTKSIKDGKISPAILRVAKKGAVGKLIAKDAKAEDVTQMSVKGKKTSVTAQQAVKQTLDNIGKSENFDPANKEITNQLPAMVKVQIDNYFNNRPSLKADKNVRQEVQAEVLFRLINPSKTGRTDINGFKPKINDSLYGYLNKRINYRMLDTFKENPTIVPDFTKVDLEDAAKFLTPEDVVTPKKTEGVKTKLVQTKARQLTSLADLDIESSPLIKETTRIKLTELIKSNPKNIVQEIQNVLIPDLVEITRKEMGVIGEKAGKLVVPESYKAYLADTYEQTISSMEILKIRTNYKNLFKRENMGFADYKTKKSDKPSLKKDSNYRKDIFRNVTTKAEFTKYHTEGKKNKLIANQRNLALMRAEAEAVQAADNYIIENSNDLNQVYAAELRKYIDSKTVEKQKLEDKSFDSVKFSKTRQEQQVELTQKSLKQVKDLVNLIDNNAITDVFNLETQQPIKGKYDSEVVQIVFNQFLKGNIYSNRHKALVDIIKKIPKSLLKGNLGTAIEQYKIDVGNKAAKKYEGLTMLGEAVQEGGIPDFFADIHGFALYAEAKFGASRGGKVSTNFTNWLTGKFKINKKLEGNIEFVEKSVKRALKGSKQLVKDLKDLGFDLVDQDTVVDLKTHKELGAKKAIVSDTSVVVDADYIGRIYANKEYPVYLIDIDGAGLFYMPGDPFIETLAKELGIPKLEGKFPLITRILPQRKLEKGVKVGYKYKLTTEPLIDPNNIKVKSDFSLSDIKTFDAIMNSKAVANLKTQQEAKNKAKFSKSINASRTVNDPKGITVLDFDDTLATTKSLVRYTAPDGTTGTLNAEQFANSYQGLLDKGYKFDFSEFNKVVKGKIAPLFQKALKLQGKFGPENMFVLTARPPQAQKAIFDFLKANGLNIPLKNITGLGNSTAEAKALWIADKVGEGYNDFYFADDALQNVQAVDNMLEQFDVKRKVQQAKVKFSKTMNDEFNDILEDVTGIESVKRFDFIKARKRGASKGKFRFFIPPSHEDFVGLLYNFMGKGRKGDAHRNFFEKALVRPLNRANREYDTARQSIATDYKNLNKAMPDVKKMLTKKTPDGDFTYQDAIRVYLWNKHGYTIPGLSPIDQKKLVELVKADSMLQSYADTINIISKQEAYVDPTEGWDSGDIRMDLDDATGRVGREQFFAEFNENANIIFSTENLNKIEAGYGKAMKEALEDMLYRIKTGRNRPSGQNKLVNGLMNYLNGSVGSVMFFNMRSALLQQMSLVNYINFADNNIFAAAKAFANQKQYWNDWSFIFNSDMLKQRRGGIQTDVNGAELAAEMRKSKNPHRFLISKLLQLGFLPTQIGDNIAIATGGATYYRNRINTYLKEGLSKKEAEAKAFTDFQDITQSTQQSARPDMVSQQQASILGKIILNFQNVTSQFNRLGKKAFLDIKNRRITKPNKTQMQSDISNAARITYYFAVQNAIFYSLQTALFMMLFGDDEEDNNKLFLKKQDRLINGSIDSILRGSGVTGAVISTLKNVAIAFARQRDVNYNPDESAVVVEALNFSPVVGIKARKIVNAEKTLNYNKKVIKEMDDFDIDNPQWSAVTNYIEGFTNTPLNRLYNKTQNVRQALNNEHSAWERMLMFLGWSQYNLGLENTKIENIKKNIKANKKSTSKVSGKVKSKVSSKIK